MCLQTTLVVIIKAQALLKQKYQKCRQIHHLPLFRVVRKVSVDLLKATAQRTEAQASILNQSLQLLLLSYRLMIHPITVTHQEMVTKRLHNLQSHS